MIFRSAYRAFGRIFTAPFRVILWKSLGLTLFLLSLSWFALRHAFMIYIWPLFDSLLPGLPAWLGWLGIIAFFTLSVSLAFLLALFITPITAFVGSFFVDQAIEIIEQQEFPTDPKGEAMPLGQAVILSLRFVSVSLLANAALLLLLFLPVAHLVGFYCVNAYLLGKEYFLLNALRFHKEACAKMLYQKHKATIFAAGFVVTLFLSIPFLNLLTPLFAASIMAYLYKDLTYQQNLSQKNSESDIMIIDQTKIDILPPENSKK